MMKLVNINVEFLIDTDQELDVCDLRKNKPYKVVNKRVHYSIVNMDEIKHIICKEIEELKELSNSIDVSDYIEDEFVSLCGACTLDFKQISPQMLFKQTKDNPCLYIQIYAFIKE